MPQACIVPVLAPHRSMTSFIPPRIELNVSARIANNRSEQTAPSVSRRELFGRLRQVKSAAVKGHSVGTASLTLSGIFDSRSAGSSRSSPDSWPANSETTRRELRVRDVRSRYSNADLSFERES
jgi:hypothetical protein